MNDYNHGRETAIDLFKNGTPNLGKTMSCFEQFQQSRDQVWRKQMEIEFCRRAPESTCANDLGAWFDAHDEVNRYKDPQPEGSPKPCERCLTIRGTTP